MILLINIIISSSSSSSRRALDDELESPPFRRPAMSRCCWATCAITITNKYVV